MRSNATLPALTPKQQRFVEPFLLDLNATQAAIRAGYSERTANQQSPRLLENRAQHLEIAQDRTAAIVRLTGMS